MAKTLKRVSRWDRTLVRASSQSTEIFPSYVKASKYPNSTNLSRHFYCGLFGFDLTFCIICILLTREMLWKTLLAGCVLSSLISASLFIVNKKADPLKSWPWDGIWTSSTSRTWKTCISSVGLTLLLHFESLLRFCKSWLTLPLLISNEVLWMSFLEDCLLWRGFLGLIPSS